MIWPLAQVDPNTISSIRDLAEYLLGVGAIGVGLLVLLIGVVIVLLSTRASRNQNQIISSLITQIGEPLNKMASAIPDLTQSSNATTNAVTEQTDVVRQHLDLGKQNRVLLENLVTNQAETMANVLALSSTIGELKERGLGVLISKLMDKR